MSGALHEGIRRANLKPLACHESLQVIEGDITRSRILDLEWHKAKTTDLGRTDVIGFVMARCYHCDGHNRN